MGELIVLVKTNEKLIKEIQDANSEINRLEKAVIYLSKQVAK